MGSIQGAMDALARSGGVRLNQAGTYDEIIASGTPASDQVQDSRGFIALIAETDVVIDTISYDTNLWGGESLSGASYAVTAGHVLWLKFSAVKIASGICACVAAGQGSFTNGS